MFNDLFRLVESFEHDCREENGLQVHAYMCRRCALTSKLISFRIQILRLLRDVDFAVGNPVEKDRRS